MGKSLAKIVREILETKPYCKYGLEIGVVNYSALAKKIQNEVKDRIGRDVSHDAIAISIRRYAEGLKKTSVSREKELLKLLKNSHISIRNKIADITFKKGQLPENSATPIHTLSGTNVDVLIIDQNDIDKINMNNALEIRKNLVEISLITDSSVEGIPGFVQYITGLLAENDINLVEVISCYTDKMLILEEKDAMTAYEILQNRTNADNRNSY